MDLISILHIYSSEVKANIRIEVAIYIAVISKSQSICRYEHREELGSGPSIVSHKFLSVSYVDQLRDRTEMSRSSDFFVLVPATAEPHISCNIAGSAEFS
jgi:hypothetical protein